MELHITIDAGSDPIRGTVRTSNPDRVTEFVGWMALAEAIELARRRPADAGPSVD